MKNLKLFLSLSLGLVSLCANGEGSYTPLIEEGKVWEYFFKYNDEFNPVRRLSQYSFIGTESVNGVEYHRLVLVKTREIQSRCIDIGYFQYESQFSENSPMSLEALIREEEGKVWLHVDSEEVKEFDPDGPYYAPWRTVTLNANHEVLLYDFSAKAQDSIRCWTPFIGYMFFTPDPEMMMMDCSVISTADSEFRNTEVKVINLINPSVAWMGMEEDLLWLTGGITYVEGVGNIGDGDLIMLGGQMLDGPIGPGGYWRYFNNLYDSEGNVIYPGAGETINDPNQGNSVEEIGQESVTPGKTYDIMGREVRETVPGGIYIRNGRKFVGR